MEIAKVVDRESLRAYLDGLADDVRVDTSRYVAMRAAGRVAPIAIRYFAENAPVGLHKLTALAILGAFAFSGVAFLALTFGGGRASASSAAAKAASSASSITVHDDSSAAVAAAYASSAAVFVASADVANAVFAVSEAADAAGSIIWEKLRADLTQTVLLAPNPLWPDKDMPQQIADDWAAACIAFDADKNDWRFWITFYNRLLDGKDIHADLLAPTLSNLTEEDWIGDPALVTPLFDDVLAVYEAEDAAVVSDPQTDVSKAAYFDFIEVNRQMRAVSFPSDQSAFADDAARDEFLTAAKDLRICLQDWVDLARAHLQGRNAPVTTAVSIEHILDQLTDLEAGKDVSLRNLVRLGSNAKRLARGEEAKADLGDNLHEILNEALDDYSALMRIHLGDVLAALDALKSLELGDLDSAELLASMKMGYARLLQYDADELLQPDPQTRAIFNDMLADLEDEQSEIAEATTLEAQQTRAKRFAEKVGGVSATFGVYLDEGSKRAKNGGAKFDEAVKWHKRWQTLEEIKDWWDLLGGGGS